MLNIYNRNKSLAKKTYLKLVSQGNINADELRMKAFELKNRVVKTLKAEDMELALLLIGQTIQLVYGKTLTTEQLYAALNLYAGNLIDMKTGEGKTLAAFPAIYLKILEKKHVFVITVNDYLAYRDSRECENILSFLGFETGCVLSKVSISAKKAEYSKPIVYVTNKQLGFDYLYDHLSYHKEEIMIKDMDFCIVDEVDSILIDEARTPLIVSSGTSENTNYDYIVLANQFILKLKNEGTMPKEGVISNSLRLFEVTSGINLKGNSVDYYIDYNSNTVFLGDLGRSKLSEFIKVNQIKDKASFENYVDTALRAHFIYKKDKDYVVQGRKVQIIDEYTGRIMEGRRFIDGLHAAIEAKERLSIKEENEVSALITYQNLFKLFNTLSGMSGTSLTESKEFKRVYGVRVVKIPRHKKNKRIDLPDRVFNTQNEKYQAALALIKEVHENGQPILVGTPAVKDSVILSNLLKKSGLEHNVLNAVDNSKEAFVIAQAGKFKAITIATNMAGRGTDIMLGGNLEHEIFVSLIANDVPYSDAYNAVYDSLYSGPYSELVSKIRSEKEKEMEYNRKKVQELGGLLVIGLERNTARRIDEQLQGRSGRQGDPGKTIFLNSLEDALFQSYGKPSNLYRLYNLLPDKLSFLDARKIRIRSAQSNIEAQNREIRKQTFEFDSINNHQRKKVYQFRQELLMSVTPEKAISKFIKIKLSGEDEWENKRNQLINIIDREWTDYLKANLHLKTQANLMQYGTTKSIERYIQESTKQFKLFKDSLKESLLRK